MKKARRISSLAAVAATLSVFVLIPSLGASAAVPSLAPTPPRGAAACRASQRDLGAALGIAVNVCPDIPSARSVSPSSAHATVADAAAASASCLPTTYDKCEAWVSAPYDGAAKGIDRVGDLIENGNSMAITPDGAMLFTAGNTDRVGPNYGRGPIAILGFDAATGNRLWATQYEGPDEHPYANVESVVANNGTVFVTGYTFAGDDFGSGMTLAYDARTGAGLWEADFPGVALASAISHDGSLVFVVGEQDVEDADGEVQALATTVAYDTSTGLPVWTQSLADPDSMPLVGWRVETAPGRVTVVAGRVEEHGYTNGVVLATYVDSGSEAGGLISRIAVPLIRGNLPAGLALNADGSRAFIVQDRQSSFPESTFTAAFDTVTGTMLWTAVYRGEGVESYAIPWFFHPIDVSPNGDKVYVATLVESDTAYTEGIATVAYGAADGEEQWSVVQDRVSPVRCVASCGPSLSVNPKTGQIVVAGASLVGNRQKAVTYSYAPNGTLQWMRIASALPAGASVPVGQATESSWASIVHSPDGRHVYLGGSAWAIFNDPDSSEDVVVSAFDTAAS